MPRTTTQHNSKHKRCEWTLLTQWTDIFFLTIMSSFVIAKSWWSTSRDHRILSSSINIRVPRRMDEKVLIRLWGLHQNYSSFKEISSCRSFVLLLYIRLNSSKNPPQNYVLIKAKFDHNCEFVPPKPFFLGRGGRPFHNSECIVNVSGR